MQETKPGFVISHYFKNGEKRFLHDAYGFIYVDGYAEYEGRQYAYEYNGCLFHFCPHCGKNPDKKEDEEKRQRKR